MAVMLTPVQPLDTGTTAPDHSSAGQSPGDRSTGGRSPDGRSPDGRSPDGRSPDGQSPDGQSPDGQSPDGQSFDDMCLRHHGALLRLAYLLCGDQRRAEDEVAEALARVYVRWQRGEVGDFGPYARRAVVNQVRGGLRRRILERREEARRSGDDRGPGAFDDQIADRDALRRALLRLPVRQRASVVLRYYEDLPEAQVAEVLGVSVGSVKSQVSRGLDRLRGLLSDASGADDSGGTVR